MEKLIETLLISKLEIQNIVFHNERMNQARARLFQLETLLDLAKIIDLSNLEININYRCRVVYDKNGITEVIITPYQEKKIKILKIIDIDQYQYNYKWLNREFLHRLLDRNPEADEVIMTKNSFVTDSTIANLAFWDGDNWFVPNTPLLKGTKREKLMTEKMVTAIEIKIEDIKKFKKIALINVFRDLNIDTAIDCSTIIY